MKSPWKKIREDFEFLNKRSACSYDALTNCLKHVSGLPPGRLSDSVKSGGMSGKQLPCNTEMTILLNCFKEFDFVTEHCMREHKILEDCVHKNRNLHLQKLLMKKKGKEGKDFIPWSELDSLDLSRQLQKYPTGIRPQRFSKTVKMKRYRK